MNNNSKDNKNLYLKLARRYIIATILIFVLFFTRQMIIQFQLNNYIDSSSIINMAGRQRMLSQKIVKEVLYVVESTHLDIKLSPTKDILSYAEALKDNHFTLYDGDDEKNIPDLNNTKLRKEYEGLYPYLLKIYDNSNLFVKLYNDKSLTDEKYLKIINELKTNESLFLEKMDHIVMTYESISKDTISFINTIELILFFIIVLTAIFITLFVFLPASKVMKKVFWDISNTNDDIIKLFQTMKGPLFLVNKNGDIVLMNSDAEELLNYNGSDVSIFNIEKHVNWFNVDINEVLRKTFKNDKVENINTQLEDFNHQIRDMSISTISGYYNNDEVILITMFDMTLQKRAEEAIREIAIKDELTGLYNRHFFDTVIDEEIDRSERYDVPFSALILDLDHFKKVNDTFGHPVGDNVLRFTADIVKSHTRSADYPIRIGGEEFVVLMPHTSLEGAYSAAEKIRKAIEETTHPVIGNYTASIGVAQRERGENYKSMYNRMDNALYEAKESGRNKVIKAPSKDNYSALTLRWKPAWNSGEPTIDMQHKELFKSASKVLNNSLYTENKDDALKSMDELLNHILEHFKYEESVLEMVKYKGLPQHRHVHNFLIEKGISIRKSIEDGSLDFTSAYVYIFDEIVVNHLLKEDVKFFPLINQKK